MPPRIGLFGGSFDPPHLGHLIAAEAAATQLDLDRVLWIPTANVAHKGRVTDAHHRLAMVERAIAGNPRFELSTIDVDRGEPTYSIDTVRDVRAAHPDAELIFLLGDDSWNSLPSWHRASELMQLCEFAIVHRTGVRATHSGTSLRWVEIPAIGISSSACRSRIGAGESVRYWLTDAVRTYIDEQQLYSEDV